MARARHVEQRVVHVAVPVVEFGIEKTSNVLEAANAKQPTALRRNARLGGTSLQTKTSPARARMSLEADNTLTPS